MSRQLFSKLWISRPRIRVSLPLLALGMGCTILPAQTTAQVVPRVLGPAAGSAYVPLKGNMLPLAHSQFDRGAVPESTTTGHMVMVLKMSAAQQSSLDKLLAAQQDPKSASFHHWLTPESFGKQFGVADADIQSVTSYLASQGFSVGRVFQNKMAIEFSGTTAQVQSAFKTSIHSYAVNGQTFKANSSEPQIPAALAPVVAGITGLNDYKAPSVASAQKIQMDPGTHKAHALYSDVGNDVESVTPGDLAKIYDIPAQYTGAGVTVGVIGDSNINVNYISNYRKTFGLPAGTPTVVVDGNDPGITTDADTGVTQIELIAAVAPLAKVNYYISGSSDPESMQGGTSIALATIHALEDNDVQVIAFGSDSCEKTLGVAGNVVFGSIWQQAAAQGITVVAAAGNEGAAGCDQAPIFGGPSSATQGLAVNGYASSPYVTAVGATDFFYGPTGTVSQSGGFTQDPTILKYWLNNGNSSYTSAIGYIPEQPWTLSYQATNQFTSTPVVAASGGGVSTLGRVTPDDPSADQFFQIPWPQPSWQVPVVGKISTTARVVPDVVMFGGTLSNGSTYALCLQADECVNGAPGSLVYTVGGDTRGASAVFSGVAALIVQQKGVQGNINPTLYSLAQTTPLAFHDITNGTNAVDCTSGSPNCGANGYTSDGGALAYQATAGYDAASGLGSVDVATLIQNWKNPNSTAATISFTITQPGTNTPIGSPHFGDPVQFNLTVSGTGGTPTGDVTIVTTSPLTANAAQQRLTLSGGSASAVSTLLPGGTYQVTARYGGDATFAPVVSTPVSITIFQSASKLTVISQSVPNNGSVAYGAPVSIGVEPFLASGANAGTPTGSVQVRDTSSNGVITTLPLSSFGFATFTSSSLAAGSHGIYFTYGGDASYGSTQLFPPIQFTVQPLATTTSLITSEPQIVSGNSSVNLIATVTASANRGAAPAGFVNFQLANGTLLGTALLQAGFDANGNSVATARIRSQGSAFSPGTNIVTASFLPEGSNNFAASTSSPTTILYGVVKGAIATTTTITASPNVTQIYNYSSLSFGVSVTAKNFTAVSGTVTFFANTIQLGTATIAPDGTANFLVPTDANGNLSLTPGLNTITAQYSGDSTHAPSSNLRNVAITVYSDTTAPDFSLQSDQTYQPLSATVSTADFTLQFTSLHNFASTLPRIPITLSYRFPTGITCAAAPTQPAFNGTNYATVALSCGAANGFTASLMPDKTHSNRKWWLASSGATMACVLLFGIPARRRKWQSMLGAILVLVCIMSVAGCGADLTTFGGHNPTSSKTSMLKNPTPAATTTLKPGTYVVVVTATARIVTKGIPNSTISVSHTLPLKIVVQ